MEYSFGRCALNVNNIVRLRAGVGKKRTAEMDDNNSVLHTSDFFVKIN